MNILEFQQDSQDLFDAQPSHSFSIEEETEELINQVFNQKYEPVYNPNYTKIKEEQYRKHKKQTNQMYREKDGRKKQFNHKIYQNFDDQDSSSSFKEFLMRAQERIDKRNTWLNKQRSKKEENQIRTLKDIPQILRGSREKVMPIYERCIDLQKSKQKQLEGKRIEKYRKQVEKAQSYSYHPVINAPKQKKRTFQEYLIEKEMWQEEKTQQIERRRVVEEVKKLSQCTFTPKLVAKYNKPNPRIIPGERVEERLLRSLQKSQEKESSIGLSQIQP